MARARRGARRALDLALLSAVLATSQAGRQPLPADSCSLGARAGEPWMWPLAVTPALAETRGGALTPDELAGEWTGTAVITAARSPMKPVERAMAPYWRLWLALGAGVALGAVFLAAVVIGLSRRRRAPERRGPGAQG